MMVDEYTSKFHSLEHFHLGIYPIEHSLTMKYARGLNACLQDRVMMRGPNTLTNVIVATSKLQHEYDLTHQSNSSYGGSQSF